MGIMILASASLSVFFKIPGQSTLCDGSSYREKMRTPLTSDKKDVVDQKTGVSLLEYREEFFV
jgi:hypothetical protein